MLTIYCINRERLAQCEKEVCCCECNKADCAVRCKKEVAETCDEFEEEID